MDPTSIFKKNERLIYKQSWHYAKKYDMDFEDIKSQAFLVFCEALDRFDDSQATFTTFLFHRLRTLNDYCKKEKGIECRQKLLYNPNIQPGSYLPSMGDISGIDDIQNVKNTTSEGIDPEVSYEDRIEERILFNQALDRLSDDGKHVVENLLYGAFEKPEMDRQRSPGKYRIREVLTKEHGWPHARVDKVWTELHTWFTDNN